MRLKVERNGRYRFQICWYAKDGRILRPQVYRLHHTVPSAWGRVKFYEPEQDGSSRFTWFQLGRFMFTTM